MQELLLHITNICNSKLNLLIINYSYSYIDSYKLFKGTIFIQS